MAIEKYLIYINGRRNSHERIAEVMAAQNVGCKIIAIGDNIPNYIKPLVSIWAEIDTQNMPACVELARQYAENHKVVGVVNWSETDVSLRNLIARDLNLPLMTDDVVRRSRNKVEMKRALAHIPDLIPKFACVRTETELVHALEDIGFPAVIKPVGGSGSKGIFQLRSLEDIAAAMRYLPLIANVDHDPVFAGTVGEYIVEEYLDGPEVSVEGFVSDIGVHLVGITDKWTTEPFCLELRHVFPSNKPLELQEEINSKAKLAVAALGLANCTFHLEGRCTSRGFRFIECAARPGGDYITTHLLPISLGGVHLENCLRVTMGEVPKVNVKPLIHATARFVFAERSGTFVGITGNELAQCNSIVEHIFINTQPGSRVRLPPEYFSEQRVAVVIGKDSSYDNLIVETEKVATRLRVIMAEDNH